MYKLLFPALILTLLCGCDAFEYHPYDGRISGETNINARNIQRIETALKDKTSFNFALISDTQRRYDDTEDIVKSLNSRKDIDFVVHAGDLTDFGLTNEFMWMRDILSHITVPYVALIGNHDCLANGEELFTEIYGKVNYSFIAGNVKFVCLNTNALEYDYSNPIPDFNFIEEQFYSDKERFSKTIFAMHVRPYSEQFNNNVARIFQRVIKEYPDLQFCINGHDHSLKIDDLFGDGIMYYGCPAVYKRQYIIFNIKPDSYEYEVVGF